MLVLIWSHVPHDDCKIRLLTQTSPITFSEWKVSGSFPNTTNPAPKWVSQNWKMSIWNKRNPTAAHFHTKTSPLSLDKDWIFIYFNFSRKSKIQMQESLNREFVVSKKLDGSSWWIARNKNNFSIKLTREELWIGRRKMQLNWNENLVALRGRSWRDLFQSQELDIECEGGVARDDSGVTWNDVSNL